MKITDARVSLLCVPPPSTYEAGGRTVTGYWHVLARVRTSSGIEGFGYVVALREAMARPLAMAARELSGELIGMHVLEHEAAWRRLQRKGSWIGPGGLLHYAISPLDIALWDAAGKTLGQPLYRLLGGATDRLPVYASDGFWYNLSLAQLAQSARDRAAEGFTAVKLRIGHEPDAAGEVRRVAAVREAVGPDMRILVDATETWDLPTAMRSGAALQEAGIHWLEDPIAHQDVAGMARLSEHLRVPIATGEHLYQASDFARLIEARGTSIALIDLGRVGGITPWMRVAALANGFGVPVCGHVLPEVHVHLATAVPNGYLIEYVPRSASILQAMPALEGGCLVAPQAPGLGLALDENAVARFTVPLPGDA